MNLCSACQGKCACLCPLCVQAKERGQPHCHGKQPCQADQWERIGGAAAGGRDIGLWVRKP